MKRVSLAALLVSLFIAHPAQAKSDVQNAIELQNKALMAAASRGDAETIVGLYTDQAVILPQGSKSFGGPRGVRAYWQGALDSGVKKVRLLTLMVEPRGDDTADEIGRYWVYGDKGKLLDAGKYLVVWKNENGAWRLHRDIYNSNPPAVAVP